MKQKMTTEDFKKRVYDAVGTDFTVLTEYLGTSKPITIRHNICNREFTTTPNRYLTRGCSCPFCSNEANHKKLAKTLEQFKQEVYDLVGDEYAVLSTEYKNNKTPITMKHNTCGNVYKVTPHNFLSTKNRCPNCNGTKLKTLEQFKQEVYDLVGDEYTIIDTIYKNNKTPITMKHNTCGNIFKMTPSNFLLQSQRCPKCFGTPKKTLEQFKQEVYDLVGDEYTVLSTEYVNTRSHINIRHNTCDTIYSTTPHNFLAGYRCKKCSAKKIGLKTRKTTDDFKALVKSLTGSEYEVLSEYINNKDPIRIKHVTCQREFEMRPNDFQQGQRCPYCANNGEPSKLEKELVDFIKSFYKETIETSKYGIIPNHQELDMYFPERKIAIEFDGLYWHSDKFKDKNYHLNKTLECLANGINLIHIFEDEWLNKQDIVKAKVKYLLGYSKNLPKIRASKCYIEEISSQDKNTFLNENHIQGEDKSSVKLGLWYPINENESRLVSVMTFCKPRKSLNGNAKYDYELSRFANDIEYQVYGSFDKLFNYFKDNYEWSSLVTYADRRWSNGGLYESTGFKLDHISKPNYWYINNGEKRYHRFVFRKSELEKKFPDIYNENLTEFEIMNKTKYYRIWDCGNLVYNYNK